MRRALVALVLVLPACSWSNSLYQARRLSSAALKAEREERTSEAGSLWGQVAVKADTAYARTSDGSRGAEALWLRGRALARLGDCPSAQPVLERAQVVAIDADWSDDLRVELARCRSLGGDPDGAVVLLRPILDRAEGDLRMEARQLAGQALVRAGMWREAVEMLADDESIAGKWDRTIALAELGRVAEALELADERLTIADSSADWDRLVRITARTAPDRVDQLLERLGAMRNATDVERARWLLAAAEGGLAGNEATAIGRLERLLTLPEAPATTSGRMLLVDRRIAAASDSGSLAAILAEVGQLVRGDPTATFRFQALAGWGRRVLSDLEEYRAGAPEGDMAMFFQAGVARDTLHAPRLASWLLLRMERGWPESPYVAKALLARLSTEPDSAAALQERLQRHLESPYLAFVLGQETPGFAVLEDSLGFYLDGRRAAVAAGEVN